MAQFGNLLYDLRKKRDLTLDAVARRAGTHKGYISGIERGKVNPPSPKFLKKFARILQYDYQELLVLAHLEKAPKEIRREMLDLFDVWKSSRS